MIIKRGYKDYEEAAKEAEALLWKYRENREQLTTIEHSSFDENKKRLPFAYIEDKETGATAYIYSFDEAQGYALTFLTGEEANEDNRTYPFRGVSKEVVPFLMALRTPIFRPVKEIKPEEALTPEGMKDIYTFFGADEEAATFTYGFLTENEVERRGYTLETAFDGEGSLICLPFPQALTQLTGVKVKTPSDYAKGISKLLKTELTEEQVKGVKSTFLFYASEALCRYSIYEFFRTENYNHLKEVLTSFRNFYLPKNWEEDFTLYYGYKNVASKELFTAEKYVLAKYLSKWNANIVGRQIRLKDVAEYTGTPLELISKTYKIRHIYDF